MPLYDHRCDNCGWIFEQVMKFEEEILPCPKCDSTAKRIFSPMRKEQVGVFKPQRFEALGDDAPVITSKQQLAEECKKRGLVSRMLSDGYRDYMKEA